MSHQKLGKKSPLFVDFGKIKIIQKITLFKHLPLKLNILKLSCNVCNNYVKLMW